MTKKPEFNPFAPLTAGWRLVAGMLDVLVTKTPNLSVVAKELEPRLAEVNKILKDLHIRKKLTMDVCDVRLDIYMESHSKRHATAEIMAFLNPVTNRIDLKVKDAPPPPQNIMPHNYISPFEGLSEREAVHRISDHVLLGLNEAEVAQFYTAVFGRPQAPKSP